MVKMIADTSEVKLRIRERYIVQITPGKLIFFSIYFFISLFTRNCYSN